MALTKYKIGQLIEIVDERNSYGIREFYGININKEFMPTVADTEALDESKYKVVRKNRFVFSGMQTGRDECIRISMYLKEKLIIVSPAYTTFEIVAQDIVLPTYFFMIFMSKEKDRLGAFYSDGSIRSNLDWDRFCDIELNLPDLPTQQKYVDIYKAMVANQQCYERGLEDLKLVCDGYIEDLRRQHPCEKIGGYIELIRQKNTTSIAKVLGISKDGFIEPKQNIGDIKNYFVFKKNDFVYSPPRINIGSIGLYNENSPAVCSPIYVTFRVLDRNVLLPEYLLLWLKRSEFLRATDFYSIASVRNNFSFDLMQEVQIPIPKIEIQQDIVDIYNTYIARKEINEKLKAQIKDICPILIKGSLEEGKA